MLVLTRKLNESIIINGDIRITIVGIRGSHVRVGIEAPDSVPIFREELHDRAERAAAHRHAASGEIGRERHREPRLKRTGNRRAAPRWACPPRVPTRVRRPQRCLAIRMCSAFGGVLTTRTG